MDTVLERRVADRTRELSALYDVTAVTSGESLDLQTTLARLLTAVRSPVGVIHLIDEERGLLRLAIHQNLPPLLQSELETVGLGTGLSGWVAEQGRPLVVHRLRDHPRAPSQIGGTALRAYVGVPMRAGGRPTGVLGVFGEAGKHFNLETIALLASIADVVGMAVENVRLYEQAKQTAMLAERQRLSWNLHDSVAQSLYSLTLLAEAGRGAAEAQDIERVSHLLGRIGETTQQVLKETRLLVYDLHPPGRDHIQLVTALRQRLDAVERRAGVNASLVVSEVAALPRTVEKALFRVAQEALNNAIKHAAATEVCVTLHTTGRTAVMEIVDNGRGFDPAARNAQTGMGLAIMRERVNTLRGDLTIESTPGAGTRIKVSVNYPLESHRPIAS